MTAEPLILLAEDNPDDAFFFDHALKKTGLPRRLDIVGNGQEVVGYLQKRACAPGEVEPALPSLVVLDIKMPLMNGFEALAWLRASQFSKLPVVILSSSEDPGDLEKAQRFGANYYVVKPSDPAGLTSLIQDLHDRGFL